MRKGNNFDEPAKIIKRSDAPERTVYALTFSEAVADFFRSRFSQERFRNFIKEIIPQKADSTMEKVRKMVRNVSFVLLMAGLLYMVFYYFGYRERIKEFDNWELEIDSINEDELFDYEIKALWENINEKYPDVDFPDGMALKFAKLYAVNQDFVGALRIPELDFFTPLLHNDAQQSKYLYRDIYGQYNRYGNPNVDYRSSMGKDGLSDNTIIYGHNTHDRLGFNILTQYMKLDGYKKAPVITLETLFERTQWKVFGVILTNSTTGADRGHLFRYLITDFASAEEFNETISGIKERSMINTGIDVKYGDKLMTLYTCYQDIFKGGRLVVFARQVRDGESAEVDVSKASFNHNARYPQAYYDNLQLVNPYEPLTTPIYWAQDAEGNWYEISSDEAVSVTQSQEVTSSEAPSAEEPSAEEPVVTEPVMQEETTEASVSEETTVQQEIYTEPNTDAPVEEQQTDAV